MILRSTLVYLIYILQPIFSGFDHPPNSTTCENPSQLWTINYSDHGANFILNSDVIDNPWDVVINSGSYASIVNETGFIEIKAKEPIDMFLLTMTTLGIDLVEFFFVNKVGKTHSLSYDRATESHDWMVTEVRMLSNIVIFRIDVNKAFGNGYMLVKDLFLNGCHNMLNDTDVLFD